MLLNLILMDFETFTIWIYKDHVIHLNYGGKTCYIPTSLIQFEEIGFDDNIPYV